MIVYSVDHFHITGEKTEISGTYFNPIMATLITGSAKLLLAIAENIAVSRGYMAYCDTDSIFVKPETATAIQEFFRPLNPYSVLVEMFKIERDDSGKPLDNVLFYGISAKRYCLYHTVNGKTEILKCSTHGLGHLTGIDGEQVWKDILNREFKNYPDRIAVSQLTITKPSILNRFRKLNKNRSLNRQIKPFNFILIGSETNKIIPCLPYTKNIDGIQFREFTDYRTGLSSGNLPLPSTAYWKSLQDVLIRYINHSDNKFDYIDGIAQRKHITVDRIRYIGKEANNLDEVNIFGVKDDSVREYDNLRDFMTGS